VKRFTRRFIESPCAAAVVAGVSEFQERLFSTSVLCHEHLHPITLGFGLAGVAGMAQISDHAGSQPANVGYWAFRGKLRHA
jgi:hypothetical protein